MFETISHGSKLEGKTDFEYKGLENMSSSCFSENTIE